MGDSNALGGKPAIKPFFILRKQPPFPMCGYECFGKFALYCCTHKASKLYSFPTILQSSHVLLGMNQEADKNFGVRNRKAKACCTRKLVKVEGGTRRTKGEEF
jgi:hypothetical protein